MNLWPLFLPHEKFSSAIFRTARHIRDRKPPIDHHLWASTAHICSPTTPPYSTFLHCNQVLSIPPESKIKSIESGKVQDGQRCFSDCDHGHIIVVVNLHGVDRMRNIQPMLLSLYLHLCCYNILFPPPPQYITEPLEGQGGKEGGWGL